MERLITIAGGGLAGLSCGLGLRSAGIPVELHEAGQYPRHRVCGEFLCGVTEETLKRLGADHMLEGAQRLETMTWFRGAKNILSAKLPIPGWGISRHLLDFRLQDALKKAGARVHENSRITDPPREGLLHCTGRPAIKGGFIGLKAHFQGLELTSDLEMHLGRGAYLGISRVERGAVNACGLFPASAIPSSKKSELLFEALRSVGLTELATRLGKACLQTGTLSAVAAFRPGWQRSKVVAAIGDAAAAIPPFTGNGMSMAFESALTAVEALTPYGRGESNWSDCVENMTRRVSKQFGLRMRLAMVMHPFLTHPAGQALLAAAVRGGLIPLQTAFTHLR
jgi:2-polyprenyl-6-methoxyphenol hydroxylase-like FAD-dependent oxidoreductase